MGKGKPTEVGMTRSVLDAVLDQQPEGLKFGMFREHLQKAVLRSLVKAWAAPSISFLGGTCLRMVHGIGRFSEDLDFSLYDSDGFDLEKILAKTNRIMSYEGYACQIKLRRSKTAVKKAEIQFPGLMYQAGLSPHASQNFRIKFEVDTNPPAHSRSERQKAHVDVAPEGNLILWCHDLGSLMAGKLAALLTRPWMKGRDVYDLDWFLRAHPGLEPNFDMLNAALEQSAWEGEQLTPLNWLYLTEQKLQTFDFEKAQQDIALFQLSRTSTPIAKHSLMQALRDVERKKQ